MTQVEFITDAFVEAHGRSPRGRGWWAFSWEGNTTDGIEGEDWVAFTGTYSEAKRAAVAWARERGYNQLTVCS